VKLTISVGQGDAEVEAFYAPLGGLKGTVAAPILETAADSKASSSVAKSLHKVSDASGSVSFSNVNAPKITLAQFDSGDVFVFDIGKELFVWVGKGS